MRHAYRGAVDRPIVLWAQVVDEQLRISIRDWGDGTLPPAAPRRMQDPLTPGGIGLICLHELMDQVEYFPQDEGMLLVMSRRRGARRHGRPPPPPA
jgi:anti-sigma regulatory factor (Ser/Thr protein kinase)